MNTEGADRDNREEPSPEVKLFTAKDALRFRLRPIERGVIPFDGFRLMGKGRGGGEQCHL